MNKQMKFRKKAMATILGGIVLTSSFGLNALAEGAPMITKYTKVITKEASTMTPNTSFSFNVVPGTKVDASGTQRAIYPGPEGGVAFGGVTFTPALGEGQTEVKQEGNITVNQEKFANQAPGIYRYKVTEVPGNYEGITYSNEEFNFDVYVGQDGKLESYAFTNKESTAKSGGTFTNDYGTLADTIHDLTVTKKVTGNQGDTKKDFEFKVTVNGATDEQYKVTIKKTAEETGTVVTLTSGQTHTFNLKHDGSIRIDGLSENDKVTVDETDYTADGYKTTGELTDLKVIKDGTTKEITNNKEVSTPTGIIKDVAPYVLLVAVAGGLLFVSFRKKEAR